MVDLIKQYPTDNSKITSTHERIMNFISLNKSIPEIAIELKITEPSIFHSTLALIKEGYPITKSHLNRYFAITSERFEQVSEELPTDDSLETIPYTEIKYKLSVDMSSSQIRLILEYHRVRYYLKKLLLNFDDPDEKASKQEPVQIVKDATDSIESGSQKNFNDDVWGCDEDEAVFLENAEQLLADIEPNNAENAIDNDVLELMEVVQEMSKKENKCDLTQFEMNSKRAMTENTKPEVKAESSQSSKTRQSITQKVVPAKKIRYSNSSSDEEDDDGGKEVPSKLQERKLPSWLLNGRGANLSNKTNAVPIKKKTNFF